MKSSIEDSATTKAKIKLDYPYLGVLDDQVVLFSSKDTGVLLAGREKITGIPESDWNESQFTSLPYDQFVNLSN